MTQDPLPEPAADAGSPTADGVPGSSPGRRGDRRLLGLALGVALVVWLIDQLSKSWAEAHLQGEPPVHVIGDWLTLTFLRNPGAAFSFGTGSTVVFTLVAIVVVVVILRVAGRLRSAWWAVALGALLGGALGNLTDRLAREPGFPGGHVVDFVSVKYFAVFNGADMAITGSAVLIVVLVVLGVELSGRRRDQTTEPAAEPAPPDASEPGAGPAGTP